MRRAARRDGNELLLVHTARKMGALMVYQGPLDWLCGHKDRWILIEVKTSKGRYTPFQKAFIKECESRRLPVHIWRTIEDVNRTLNGS